MGFRLYSRRDLPVMLVAVLAMALISLAFAALAESFVDVFTLNGKRFTRSDPEFHSALAYGRTIFGIIGIVWLGASWFIYTRIRKGN